MFPNFPFDLLADIGELIILLGFNEHSDYIINFGWNYRCLMIMRNGVYTYDNLRLDYAHSILGAQKIHLVLWD